MSQTFLMNLCDRKNIQSYPDLGKEYEYNSKSWFCINGGLYGEKLRLYKNVNVNVEKLYYKNVRTIKFRKDIYGCIRCYRCVYNNSGEYVVDKNNNILYFLVMLMPTTSF